MKINIIGEQTKDIMGLFSEMLLKLLKRITASKTPFAEGKKKGTGDGM